MHGGTPPGMKRDVDILGQLIAAGGMMSEEQSRSDIQFPFSQTFDPRAVHRKGGKEETRQHMQTISKGVWLTMMTNPS